MTPEARLRTDFSFGGGQATAAVRSRDFECQVEDAVSRSANWLLSAQSQDGYWWGELEADTTLESDYILYLHVLGQLNSEKVAKLANYIRKKQLADGGWSIFEGGPSELNASVKAYVALRLAGDAATAPHIVLAKEKVIELGGIEATNSYVRFYLAMVGAIDWGIVPSIPPELMLLPEWVPINIYEMSSWTRGIVIPLSIIYGNKPDWHLPEGVTVNELFKTKGEKPHSFDWDKRIISWRNVFLALDRAGVSGQEPGNLQNAAQIRLVVGQRAADAVPHGAGLARQSAAIDRAGHVELVIAVGDQERLRQQHTQHRTGEILHHRTAIHGDLALAGLDPDPRHRLLAPAGGIGPAPGVALRFTQHSAGGFRRRCAGLRGGGGLARGEGVSQIGERTGWVA